MNTKIRINKALINMCVIPNSIIWVATGFCLMTFLINLCTTLTYGFGDNYTSTKTAIMFGIASLILVYLGLDREKTMDLEIENNVLNVYTFDGNDRSRLVSAELATIRFLYLSDSNDLLIKIKTKTLKHRRITIRIQKDDNEVFIKYLKLNNTNIKEIDDSIKFNININKRVKAVTSKTKVTESKKEQ